MNLLTVDSCGKDDEDNDDFIVTTVFCYRLRRSVLFLFETQHCRSKSIQLSSKLTNVMTDITNNNNDIIF